MTKFILLATDPDFQPFQWSWPGNHQPMHATMIMLIDLYERPHSSEAPHSRTLIDTIFSLSGPDGGVVGGEDGVSTARPLRDGGREAWRMMKRLREKAWLKAGLDPNVLWTGTATRTGMKPQEQEQDQGPSLVAQSRRQSNIDNGGDSDNIPPVPDPGRVPATGRRPSSTFPASGGPGADAQKPLESFEDSYYALIDGTFGGGSSSFPAGLDTRPHAGLSPTSPPGAMRMTIPTYEPSASGGVSRGMPSSESSPGPDSRLSSPDNQQQWQRDHHQRQQTRMQQRFRSPSIVNASATTRTDPLVNATTYHQHNHHPTGGPPSASPSAFPSPVALTQPLQSHPQPQPQLQNLALPSDSQQQPSAITHPIITLPPSASPSAAGTDADAMLASAGSGPESEMAQTQTPGTTTGTSLNFDWDEWNAVFGQDLPVVDAFMDLDMIMNPGSGVSPGAAVSPGIGAAGTTSVGGVRGGPVRLAAQGISGGNGVDVRTTGERSGMETGEAARAGAQMGVDGLEMNMGNWAG